MPEVGRIFLAIAFVLELEGLKGVALCTCPSPTITKEVGSTQANGGIHRKKSAGVGSNGKIKVISLYFT